MLATALHRSKAQHQELSISYLEGCNLTYTLTSRADIEEDPINGKRIPFTVV